MAASVPGTTSPTLRGVWLIGTLVLTLAAFTVMIVAAPAVGAEPDRGLTWLLFIGSSTHVASTGWFFSRPQVRGYARARPGRYLVAPALLVVSTALLAGVVAPQRFAWLLLGFFAWQFFHFQKQNVGLAVLAGVSESAGRVSPAERWALIAAGLAGIVGLLAHPELLQLDVRPAGRVAFPIAASMLAAAVVTGVVLLARRPRAERPPAYVAIYLTGLLFFVPVFVFRSPYAAVAGITVAHGLQYLLLVGLVAAGDADRQRRAISLAVLLVVAVVGGIALDAASHQHDADGFVRVVFGAYLGLVMAHFVVDAGLWRLRDQFPRQMMLARVPYLMGVPGVMDLPSGPGGNGQNGHPGSPTD